MNENTYWTNRIKPDSGGQCRLFSGELVLPRTSHHLPWWSYHRYYRLAHYFTDTVEFVQRLKMLRHHRHTVKQFWKFHNGRSYEIYTGFSNRLIRTRYLQTFYARWSTTDLLPRSFVLRVSTSQKAAAKTPVYWKEVMLIRMNLEVIDPFPARPYISKVVERIVADPFMRHLEDTTATVRLPSKPHDWNCATEGCIRHTECSRCSKGHFLRSAWLECCLWYFRLYIIFSGALKCRLALMDRSWSGSGLSSVAVSFQGVTAPLSCMVLHSVLSWVLCYSFCILLMLRWLLLSMV